MTPDQKTSQMKVLLPPGWPRPRGYANGVSARGRTVHVAGMIGWDTEGRFAPGGMGPQVRQALSNVVAVLAAGDARPAHIVRMTWYVTDKAAYIAAYSEIGAAFRELIGCFNAAMTAVQVVALIEDEALVEIEVTAVVPD